MTSAARQPRVVRPAGAWSSTAMLAHSAQASREDGATRRWWLTYLGTSAPEQRAAVLAVAGPVCIIAGASTGKTRTVTYRLAHAIATGQVDARRTLTITHSREAAAELGDRSDRLGASTVDARTFYHGPGYASGVG
jgi:ATP-dependent exoDNAse (exonuclease V) alpha subunit